MSRDLNEQQLEGLINFAENYRHLTFGRLSVDRDSQYEYYFMWKELARDLNYMGDECHYKGAIEYQRIWSQLKNRTRSKITQAVRLAKLKGRQATVYLTETEQRIYRIMTRGMPNDPNIRILNKDSPKSIKSPTKKRRSTRLIKNREETEKGMNDEPQANTENETHSILQVQIETETSNKFQSNIETQSSNELQSNIKTQTSNKLQSDIETQVSNELLVVKIETQSSNELQSNIETQTSNEPQSNIETQTSNELQANIEMQVSTPILKNKNDEELLKKSMPFPIENDGNSIQPIINGLESTSDDTSNSRSQGFQRKIIEKNCREIQECFNVIIKNQDAIIKIMTENTELLQKLSIMVCTYISNL